MLLFLMDYDRRAGRIVTMRTFGASERSEAAAARLRLEIELNRAGIEREVVLLEAASEEALRKTHRRYFENWETLAQFA